jgi:hypothetical protein
MKFKFRTTMILLSTVVLLSGCFYQSRTQAEFGDSVRTTTEKQIYDMNAALNPDPNAVLGGDAERLNNILDTHREDVSRPAEDTGGVTINVGGSR